MAVPSTLLKYAHETPHFILSYAYISDVAARTDRRYDPGKPTSPRHGVRNFAYVENMGIYFEEAWRYYFQGPIRYRMPPGVDETHKYRIFIYDIGRVYGITYAERVDLPSESHIVMRNNYQGFGENDDPDPEQGSAKVTAAHEFFHAVQFAYPVGDDWDWWMEASATFMEDEIFDAVNDYRNYLDDWFGAPELPLDRFDGRHEYGSVMFCKHLAEKFGGEATIEAVWRKASRPSALRALDGALKARQRKLASGNQADVFSQSFVVSNLLKDHPQHGYEEGRRYPSINVGETFTAYPVPSRQVSLDHLAATYLRFRPPAQAKTLHLAFGMERKRRSSPPVRVIVLVQGPGRAFTQHEVRLSQRGGDFVGGLEVPGFGRTAQARLVVTILANTTWGTGALDGLAVTYAANLE
jgi:hypothetical protein